MNVNGATKPKPSLMKQQLLTKLHGLLRSRIGKIMVVLMVFSCAIQAMNFVFFSTPSASTLKLLKQVREYYKDVDPNAQCPKVQADISSNTTNSDVEFDNTFDKIQNILFNKAIQTPTLSSDATPRERLSLKGWSRGTGGLNDQDRFLLGELYYYACSVFEFGLGESTLIAAKVGVPRYAGVDSDARWVARSRTNTEMSHFRFSFADIGDTKYFGHPADPTLSKIGYDYQIAPLAVEQKPFDVYLVDGRYRIACACASFLHAIKHGGDMTKVLVAVHDNDKPKRGYQSFLGIADVVFQAKKLWVYKLKENFTEEDIFKLWEASQSEIM